MGGHLSHEYHFLASIGEEKLSVCSSCNNVVKIEGDFEENTSCTQCSNTNLNRTNGIEVI